jgi:hypothetical protein
MQYIINKNNLALTDRFVDFIQAIYYRNPQMTFVISSADHADVAINGRGVGAVGALEDNTYAVRSENIKRKRADSHGNRNLRSTNDKKKALKIAAESIMPMSDRDYIDRVLYVVRDDFNILKDQPCRHLIRHACFDILSASMFFVNAHLNGMPTSLPASIASKISDKEIEAYNNMNILEHINQLFKAKNYCLVLPRVDDKLDFVYMDKALDDWAIKTVDDSYGLPEWAQPKFALLKAIGMNKAVSNAGVLFECCINKFNVEDTCALIVEGDMA